MNMIRRMYDIALLIALLAGISTPAAAKDYTGRVSAEKILVTTTAGNGQKHTYLKTDRPEVTAMTVEIPPGAETGWHLHTVPVYAYVLSGVLQIEIADGKTLTFKPGDAIVEVQNLGHNGVNRGAETVRLVVFYTGEEGRANVTRLDKPAPAADK